MRTRTSAPEYSGRSGRGGISRLPFSQFASGNFRLISREGSLVLKLCNLFTSMETFRFTRAEITRGFLERCGRMQVMVIVLKRGV